MHCAPCLQNLHYCRLKCLHAGYHIYIYFLNICAQDPKVYVPKNPHPNISPAPVHHTPIVRFSRFTGFLYSQVLLVQKSSCRHSIFRTLNLLTVACLRKSSVSRTLLRHRAWPPLEVKSSAQQTICRPSIWPFPPTCSKTSGTMCAR